jgi:ribosomal protein L33
MARRGNKVQVSVWICADCKGQSGHTYLNKANNPKLERKRFCSVCRKHVVHSTKAEKSGSLGLARNK